MPTHTIQVQQAYAGLMNGKLRLIDIRQPYELLTGMAKGSETVVQAELEQNAAQLKVDRPLALICQRGIRSAQTAEKLAAVGVIAMTVEGGIDAWKTAGLPLFWPDSELNRTERERYLRHLALPQVGEEGQLKLRKGRVLLIGAGGLGSPAALYLAAAGVGHIGIVDDDVVELSNLQRQILYGIQQVGDAKVESARSCLYALNDQIRVSIYKQRLQQDNVAAIMQDYDLVIDGSDNFPTRYLVNDACIRYRKPLIYGAVQQFSGQVSMFEAGRNLMSEGPVPCYRCLFPEPPLEGDAPNCAEAGVLGVLPGIVGCLQATEAIKWLLGIGQPLIGRLLIFDALEMRLRSVGLQRDPDCAWCDPNRSIETYADDHTF